MGRLQLGHISYIIFLCILDFSILNFFSVLANILWHDGMFASHVVHGINLYGSYIIV